jgi:hypothetical protein
MTKHRTITGFVAVALLAVVATAATSSIKQIPRRKGRGFCSRAARSGCRRGGSLPPQHRQQAGTGRNQAGQASADDGARNGGSSEYVKRRQLTRPQ